MQFSSTLAHHKIASRCSRHNTKKIKCTLKTVTNQLVAEKFWNVRDRQS